VIENVYQAVVKMGQQLESEKINSSRSASA
jgi:hypothetical protein